MQILYGDKKEKTALILEPNDLGDLVTILASALLQKPLNKQSRAYKLAKKLDDELPAY
jgi:hypothetical protein